MASNDNIDQTPLTAGVSEVVMFSDRNGPPIMMVRHGNHRRFGLEGTGAGNSMDQKDREDPLGEYAPDSDDDLSPLENEDNNNDNTEEQKEVDRKRKVTEPKKAHIPSGISKVTSKMDEKGNLDISVVYDVNCYKCCVCFEGIVGPIISCDNSHSLCSDCQIGVAKTGDTRCPVCRSPAKGRNYLLESALLEFITKCSNKGCKHTDYPENMKDHEAVCRYSEIKCPWCEEKTTPFDLQAHTEFKCEKKFSVMSCSNRIDFIKSEKINNIFIQSAMEETRIMYVEKTETECRFMCVQGRNVDDQVNNIVMTYEVPVKSLDDMKLSETRKIMIPIHKPEHLIKGRVLMHTIPIKAFVEQQNMIITGFKEKYMTGGRWMVMDRQGSWYRARITKRMYSPDRILVKFDQYPLDKYDEWVELIDGESKKIRPLEANGGRTTQEEVRHIQNMDEDEQLRLVMERSMNEM